MRYSKQLVMVVAAAVAALTNGVGAQDDGASANLTIDRIQPTYSFAPGEILVEGTGLDTVTEVTLGSSSVPIVSQTATTMVVAPPAGPPGFPILRVWNGTEGVSRSAWMWPNLRARTDGIGGRIRISLANGGSGLFMLGYALDHFDTPQPVLAPPTWYGLLLDMNGLNMILAADVFLTAESRHLSYDVPDDPVLAGTTIYFQAWCRQDFSGTGTTWSFTNLGGATF